MRFKDRREAGVLLAEKLAGYRESVIYAIPRGDSPQVSDEEVIKLIEAA